MFARQKFHASSRGRFLIPILFGVLFLMAPSLCFGDWMPSRWGEWHLGDVWLDRPEVPAADLSATPPAAASSLGAHP